jgi:hypothetical protein
MPRVGCVLWSLTGAHPGPYDVRVHPGRTLLSRDLFGLRARRLFRQLSQPEVSAGADLGRL